MNDKQTDNHWLVRPDTIRKLWWAFSVLLALTIFAQLFIYVKGYFGVDGLPGFAAAFGFLSCFAMVVFAKFLGELLKRDEDYYDKDYYAAGDDDV